MCHLSLEVNLGSVECITGRNVGFIKAFGAQKHEDNCDALRLFKIRPSDHQADGTVMLG